MTLNEARYSLHEAYAERIWHAEKQQPPSNEAALFFARFYLDDAALRMYAAGEHLAEAILDILEIDEKELEKYRERRASLLKVVRRFLENERANHPLSQYIVRLVDCAQWNRTIKYRNNWVHGQPPLIRGTGIVFKRGKRWKVTDDGSSHLLYVGGGDEPDYSIDQVLTFVRPALVKLSKTITIVMETYIDVLRDKGIALEIRENDESPC